MAKIKRNSQAIRWCKAHKMTISFDNWRDKVPGGVQYLEAGVTCRLSATDSERAEEYPMVYGRNLIDCVNDIINQMEVKKRINERLHS